MPIRWSIRSALSTIATRPRLLLLDRRPCRLGGDAALARGADFSGKTLEEALAWCLVWLMAPEIGVGPFRV